MSEFTCRDCGGLMQRGTCEKCGGKRTGTTDGMYSRELRLRERDERREEEREIESEEGHEE